MDKFELITNSRSSVPSDEGHAECSLSIGVEGYFNPEAFFINPVTAGEADLSEESGLTVYVIDNECYSYTLYRNKNTKTLEAAQNEVDSFIEDFKKNPGKYPFI